MKMLLNGRMKHLNNRGIDHEIKDKENQKVAAFFWFHRQLTNILQISSTDFY